MLNIARKNALVLLTAVLALFTSCDLSGEAETLHPGYTASFLIRVENAMGENVKKPFAIPNHLLNQSQADPEIEVINKTSNLHQTRSTNGCWRMDRTKPESPFLCLESTFAPEKAISKEKVIFEIKSEKLFGTDQAHLLEAEVIMTYRGLTVNHVTINGQAVDYTVDCIDEEPKAYLSLCVDQCARKATE